MKSDQETTRRGFLDVIIAIGTALSGAALAIPGVVYLWPAARGGGAKNVEVPGASSMSPGDSKMIQVGGKAVIVVRGRDSFLAFSASCTHLGCLVNWDSDRREFLCPCHAAVFDASGKVVSGPPPSPLPAMKIKTVKDKVFVSA